MPVVPVTRESLLTVRVSPRASRNQHQFDDDGIMRLWLSAPPVEGAANKAVLGYLANLLDLPPSSLAIVLGQSSRIKRVRIPLDAAELSDRISRHK